MSRPLMSYVLEGQLEIEKVVDAEKAAGQEGEAAVLYDELHQQNQADETAEELKEDTGTEDAPEEGSEPAPEDDTSTDSMSLESINRHDIRNLSYVRENDESTWDHTTPEGARSLAGTFASLGFGIAASVFSSLYNGVTYLLLKIARLTYVSAKTLSKYLERRTNSFASLKKEIAGYKESVSLLEKKEEAAVIENQQYDREKVINCLKSGESVDFTKNMQSLNKFLQLVVGGLDTHIANDMGSIKHLVQYSVNGTTKIPDTIMAVQPLSRGLVEGQIEGYQLSSDLVECFYYGEGLPADVALIVNLPARTLTEMDDITKAYNHSKIFLGFNQSGFREVPTVPFMDTQSLGNFLNELDSICDLCIAHQVLYERAQRNKSDMTSVFRSFVTKLTSSNQKVSIQDSLAEQIYLKSMFIDKVYLAAAMDIHDYSARIISNGLSYVKENIKRLA